MMHKASSSIEEVPYCFSRSSIKFQGHTALKIIEFDPNWAFPDCNSSLNSPMAMKCCTKLETAKERCPIVFQGYPSNFKVTRDKTSPILTQIRRFRTIGRSQLSNPSDLPCLPSAAIGANGYCRHCVHPSARPAVRLAARNVIPALTLAAISLNFGGDAQHSTMEQIVITELWNFQNRLGPGPMEDVTA